MLTKNKKRISFFFFLVITLIFFSFFSSALEPTNVNINSGQEWFNLSWDLVTNPNYSIYPLTLGTDLDMQGYQILNVSNLTINNITQYTEKVTFNNDIIVQGNITSSSINSPSILWDNSTGITKLKTPQEVQIDAQVTSNQDAIFGRYLLNYTNPNGIGSFIAYNDVSNYVAISIAGSGTGDFANKSGLFCRGGDCFVQSAENKSIIFGHSPDGSGQDTIFYLKIDPLTQGLELQGDKFIRPVNMSGGAGLAIQSRDSLDEGQYPLFFTARDSEDKSLAIGWYQIGKNNSYSGMMNSFGTVPKSWVDFGSIATDPEGIEFLNERSNYINYCNYLQNNLSLVETGCRYYADTKGRTVPLLFGGDLEIHRSAFIHEGLSVRESFNVLDLNGSNVNILGGALYPRFSEIIEEGINQGQNFSVVKEDFELGNLGSFTSTDWTAEEDVVCPYHLNAGGTFCSLYQGIVLAAELNTTFTSQDFDLHSLNFILTADLDGPGVNDGTLNVTINNNTGSGDIELYYISTVSLVDQNITIDIPDIFDNVTLNTLKFTYTGASNAIGIYVDNININATATESTLANVTRLRSQIKLLDNAGKTEIYAYEESQTGRNIINYTADIHNFIGNVTSTSVTELEINVTDNITANNFITREGIEFFDTEERITDWDNVSDYDENILLTDGSRPVTANLTVVNIIKIGTGDNIGWLCGNVWTSNLTKSQEEGDCL